ncbi:hypothetical protein ABB37_01288 [Leptomonas pyrrhocoris]|uniref:CS domain-containing protein n=1 Tax=Leptomonas pyrrhocoris TaxID=157538 RepID=A0A0M9G8G9_LEPPY|nr:hypothetical protein ABB37_01288 [Leptomonas pyrrhocoris]XP_015663247.1 hypothetical protein ABB37_01288 [Leptomonas pyrrhocoris]KPA84807.1 hypothetical protein ABB37_01288 [Leptomonas pyrrhocoris]KPA84808.1 hypothetical protein ABB37_01288 [Leptomonas pyrrhocoris]|eukprot:XP_015663246.1 hypothetical protein ABB37_01288 [Leptomonas pyrrhocoris]
MSAEEQLDHHAEEPKPTAAQAEKAEESGKEAATTATPANEAQPSSSAKKNKANSYYYWHGHEKERAKHGDVAPMPTPHLVSKDDNVTVTVPVVPTVSVSKYSWCDGDKFVSVYVEAATPASGETLADDSIEAVFTRNSFTLSFTTTDQAGKKRTKQMVTRLAKRIDADRSSTKVKPKTQEILVKLAKKVPSVWLDLEGNASDRDSADDEPPEEKCEEEDDEE